MTDEEARRLCAEAQLGCEASRDRLVVEHIQLARLVAMDWLGAFGGAAKRFDISLSDLEQDLLLEMVAVVIPTYWVDGPLKFRSYARRKMSAALWRQLKYLLRQRRLHERASPFLRDTAEEACPPRPDDAYDELAFYDELQQMLRGMHHDGRLEPEQLTVMTLSVRGYSGTAISKSTGIPVRTVYHLISGARDAIREEMANAS